MLDWYKMMGNEKSWRVGLNFQSVNPSDQWWKTVLANQVRQAQHVTPITPVD